MPRPKKVTEPGTSTVAVESSAPNAAADAFAKVEGELEALPADALRPLPADLQAAINAVLAAVPALRAQREAIEERLPKHPLNLLDDLEVYARAASYASLVHVYSATAPEAVAALRDEGAALCKDLLIAAEALAHRSLLDPDAVAQIRTTHGKGDVAGALAALSLLFKDGWGRVSSKTAIERREVERAATLGPALLVASAVTRHAGSGVDTDQQRTRAYTLLANAYDACRQALSYIRWKEGDADTIAPPLDRKRPGRKPNAKGKSVEEAPEETPAPE